MNGNETKTKQLFLEKNVKITRWIGDKSYFYRGICLEITESHIVILDKLNGAMSFPTSSVTIEVTQ